MSGTGRFVLAGRLGVALLIAGLATAVEAGGPLYTYDYENRIPYAWNMASWPDGKVPVYTDLGTLGPLTNARANEMVAYAANQWSTVPTSSFRAAVAGDFTAIGLGDIDADSITSIIGSWTGGGLRMVYDNDGSIMTNYFGLPPTGVLGITNIDFVDANSPEILQAWMVLSGPGIHPNDPTGIGFQGVVTHEMGHALNLAHSQANGAVWNPNVYDSPQPEGCAAPWAADTFPGASQVETMYPISDPEPGNTGEYMGTVDRLDDRSALSDIYPAPGYPASRGTISGQIMDTAGVPIAGIDIIARNIADPFNDFSSYISGQVSKGQTGPDGSFALNDLTPGARYVIYVDQLLAGAFAVPTVIVLPGPEEWWNGAMESGDASSDDRCAWTTIATTAGSPANASITFNKYPGAPTLMVAPAVCAAGDITADGSIVVGKFDGPNPPVFRWDLNTGAFDDIGGFASGGVGISDDGTKIASSALDTDGSVKAAIYQNDAWTLVPPVPGSTPCVQDGNTYYSNGNDISGDGSTVVGLSYGQGCYRGGLRAFKWTAAGGSIALPKSSSFNYMTRADAVNYDGTVIVGLDEATSGFWRGAFWKNGVIKLITRNGQNVQGAADVSRDGQYIVGGSSPGATSNNAWRYSVAGNSVELLGLLAGYDSSVTNAISDDHGVITGSTQSSSSGAFSPMLWTAGLHWSSFNDFLTAQGVYGQNVGMYGATAMSSDGHVMTGTLATQYGPVSFALKTPTSLVCHAPAGSPTQIQTTIVSFPHGLDAALAAGDTFGPCQCNATAPTGIPQVLVGKSAPGTAHVEWSAVNAATGYDLVRGSLKLLRKRFGDFSQATTDCLENDLAANSRDDADVPTAGEAFWYLVRAANCTGAATFDSGAPSQLEPRDAQIQASSSACP
jgi:uncharacterized membrane protein